MRSFIRCVALVRLGPHGATAVGVRMSELKVIFLGTSSARPTPKRFTSSVALSYGSDLFLFDCGEGTQVRLMQSSVRAARFRAVLLSHFHGDHVNGLPGLLGTMGLNGRREPLTIVGPKGLGLWMKTLRQLSILTPSFPLELVEHGPELLLEGADWAVHAVPLVHRVPTVGYRFDERALRGRFDLERAVALGVPPGPLFGRLQRGEDVTLEDGRVVQASDVVGPTRAGRRVAIITDTRVSDKVVEFARGADLLIHEATYAASESKQAHERLHSTAAQAAQIAKEAGVKQLMLTHFSTKYANVQPLLNEARAIFPATEAAWDLREWTVPVPQ